MYMLYYQTNNDVEYCIIIIGGGVPTTMTPVTDIIGNGKYTEVFIYCQ